MIDKLLVSISTDTVKLQIIAGRFPLEVIQVAIGSYFFPAIFVFAEAGGHHAPHHTRVVTFVNLEFVTAFDQVLLGRNL